MAWASLGTLGNATRQPVAGTTLALTTSAVAEVDHIVLLGIALDNTQTTDGTTSEVSGVVDSRGNTWTKLGEWCNGQGAGAAGVVDSLWGARITTQIEIGDTITATLANAGRAAAMRADEFSVTAGAVISVVAHAERSDDNTDAGALTLSGLPSNEYLFYRSIGSESSATTAMTGTAGYTVLAAVAADTGTQSTSITIRGEFTIATGTGDTSDPTMGANQDRASVFVALLASPPTQSIAPAVITRTAVITTFGSITLLLQSIAPAVITRTAVITAFTKIGIVQKITPATIVRTAVVYAPSATKLSVAPTIHQEAVIHDLLVLRSYVLRARVGRREVPRHWWRMDGYPISAKEETEPNSRVNLGDDQARLRVSAADLRGLPASIGQGTIVSCYNDQAFPVWEGVLSGPPKPLGDGTVVCAVQGYGYAAAKASARLPIRVREPGVWQDASAMPFNWPSTAAPGVTLVAANTPGDWAPSFKPIVDWLDTIEVSFGGGESEADHVVVAAVVMWSPGSTFARLKYRSAVPLNIYSCDGPDIYGTRRLEDHFGGGALHNERSVILERPGDAVVIEYDDDVGGSGADTLRLVVRPILQGETDAEFVYAEDIAGVVAARLGWDASNIGLPGIAAFDNFDRAAGAAEALSTAMGVDDLYWRARPDRGNGPVLEIGAPSKTYECSLRTGAICNLDELEQYRHVVAQYLTGSKRLAYTSISAHRKTEVVEHILSRLEGEVLTNLRLDNTLTLSIDDVQFDDEHTWFQIWRAMLAALAPRYSGTIEAWDIREAGTGRFCPDEPMGGDLIRVTDYSPIYGSLTLRINDISKGITKTIGVAAPSLPVGALSAYAGAWSSNRPDQQITGAGAVTGGTGLSAGLPPGAPGVPIGDKGFEPWQQHPPMGFESWQ